MDMKKTLKAEVLFQLQMRENETDEAAQERLFRLIYDNLCTLVDHQIDFEIVAQEVWEEE